MVTMSQILAHAADALLILASLGAAIFCLVLSRRLTRLSSIDTGLGGAIAVLSAQVDDMNSALVAMKTGSASAAERLEELNREARQLTEELELMFSACDDLDHAAPRKIPPDRPPLSTENPAEDSLSEETAPLFGSRRRHEEPDPQTQTETETEHNPPIPFFLKNRSRLAGMG